MDTDTILILFFVSSIRGGKMKHFCLLFILSIVLMGSTFVYGQFSDRFDFSSLNPMQASQESDESTADEMEVFQYLVKITLVSGSTTQGVITLQREDIVISTQVNGFDYQQRIPLEEIASMEITEWFPANVSEEENNSEQAYFFYPIQFLVTTKQGQTYSYHSRFPGIESFHLSNDFGRTMIYSIFYDYWMNIGSNNWQWYNSQNRVFDYNTTHPLPRCLSKIEFISKIEEQEEQSSEPPRQDISGESSNELPVSE